MALHLSDVLLSTDYDGGVMNRYAKRVDGNHTEIRDGLREIPGFNVADTHDIGRGFPDLVVGGIDQRTQEPKIVLMEVKDKNGKLTEDQINFFEKWQGYSVVAVWSLNDALAVFGFSEAAGA